MEDLEFMDTTAKMMEGMITQQSTNMPDLWDDVWKPTRGPMQGYLTHLTPPEEQSYSVEDLKYFNSKNKLSQSEFKHYNNLCNLSRLSVLKALYILGWEPKLGEPFTVDFLMTTLNIKENFQQYVRCFMRFMSLEKCRWLSVLDAEENTFKFLRSPPSLEEIEAGLNHITSPDDVLRDDYKLVKEVDNELVKILRGEVDPLGVLFPDQSKTKPSVEKFYGCIANQIKSARYYRKADIHMLKVTSTPANQSVNAIRPTYRCLEVGAGTATFTKIFLDHVSNNKDWEKVDLEFYFTDISAAFFSPAEKLLKDYAKSIVFKKYDMEKDPLEQGFSPGYFDMITAVDVFHVAKDLKKTLRSVRSLIKPGGLLHFTETIEPGELISFIFGLLDGYWGFEDRELRMNHVAISSEQWKRVLEDSGFNGFTVVPMYNNIFGLMSAYAAPLENNFLKELYPHKHIWMIFGEHNSWTSMLYEKLQNINRRCITVDKPVEDTFEETAIEEYFKEALTSNLEGRNRGSLEGIIYLWSLCPNTRDQSKISLPFLSLMKLVEKMEVPPRVFSVVRGAHAMDTYDVEDPNSGTLVGFCRSVFNENQNLKVNLLDLDPMEDLVDQIDEIFMNLWVDHPLSSAFRKKQRLQPKLCKTKFLWNATLPLPKGCERFQLILPKTKLISDLEFDHLQPYSILEDELEIQVKATALNFRDVFAVLKPEAAFEKLNAIGLDYGGVVVKTGKNVKEFKVGDRVIGLSLSDSLSLPSHVKVKENLIIPLQKTMTFAEGVTLPAVFSTAFYCLVRVAKMSKGETVLIHTASGGVGLIAIQLCKNIGAKVIATAGSSRKRAYLKNLGIQHVFNSRNLEFKHKILEVTEGRGVDIVLNSITGPGFKEASMDVLCHGGRFIEMSKLNVWSTKEAKIFRPDIQYEIVDLPQLDRKVIKDLLEELRKQLESGTIKPIAYEQFDALNIRGALNYLQKAKHIGKIVCIMPEVKLKNTTFITTTPLFNEESTYMVTGGRSGIGFEVVKWICKNGAKHVAILSRNLPSREIADHIEKLNRAGNHVKAFAVDVGDFEKLKSLFEDLPKHGFPQLRGIMHAAGVLKDALLENQCWDSFHYTYKPKVDGSWNLHELTKNMLLEHFVIFSSIASILGAQGQSNHSASNSFESSLAAYRKSIGLPVNCIDWGIWGEVGIGTELEFPGIQHISVSQGLMALETCLRTQTTLITVLNVESFALMTKRFPILKHYVDDTRLLVDFNQRGEAVMLNSNEFWNKVDCVNDRDEKIVHFKMLIKTAVRNILKMDFNEPIDDASKFQDMGFDSLMMLEIKNSLQNILGTRVTLTVNQVKECNSTEALANKLLQLLDGKNEDNNAINIPKHEEFLPLIWDDLKLLDENLGIESLKEVSISEVQTVLLTGATGNFGPYLLNELTQRSQVKKVYCLIRPLWAMSGVERLASRLKQLKFIDSVDEYKIEVIEGDLTLPKFGLNEKQYENLCKSVDAIIHNAAKLDHVAHYSKAPDSGNGHIRTVNVIGTLRVLEFAAEVKMKHCFYSSALLAYIGSPGQCDPDGWHDVTAFDFKTAESGYIISKYVSEQLVYKAIGKGVPCKAFRFPMIPADFENGSIEFLQNHPFFRWMASIKTGRFHDVSFPLIPLPMYHCSKISLDIFFNPNAPNDVYNLVTQGIALEHVLMEVACEFGLEMTLVQDLKKHLENADNVNLANTSKLRNYAPDYEIIVVQAGQEIKRDVKYLKDERVLEKFGIHDLQKVD